MEMLHGQIAAIYLFDVAEAIDLPAERDEILRNRISYLANDLVIPTWNAAFVDHTRAGTDAALEIIEFANSQLLQFRDHDELLDNALASIYANVQKEARWYDAFLGGQFKCVCWRVRRARCSST